MGVGVAPATEFLKQSDGFPIEAIQRDGGIAVDEYLKVRGLEDVYAIGDIAFYPQLFSGESRRVEHWNVGSFLVLLFVYQSDVLISSRLPVTMVVRLGKRSQVNHNRSLKCLCSGVHVCSSL